MSNKDHVYEGHDVDVHFGAQRCIHAAACVKGLPEVFRPDAPGPWVAPDNAPAAELTALVERCPSGALWYVRKDGGPGESTPTENTITVEPNGPLHVRGDLQIDGVKAPGAGTRLTLCRCGASKNKPYCDNAHIEAGFTDPGEAKQQDVSAPLASVPLNIKPVPKGPFMIVGSVEVRNARGEAVLRRNTTFFCRCGASANKPYCDGAHTKIGFQG